MVEETLGHGDGMGQNLLFFLRLKISKFWPPPLFQQGTAGSAVMQGGRRIALFRRNGLSFFLMNPRSLGLKPRGKTGHHCGHQPRTSVISVSQDHYILGKSVGTGAFCTVYLASCKKTQNPTAAPRAADRDWTHW